MKKISVEDIENSMVLAKNVVANSGNVLLNKGTILSEAMGRRLKNWGIGSVYVEGQNEATETSQSDKISIDELKKNMDIKFKAVISNPIMKDIFDSVLKFRSEQGI